VCEGQPNSSCSFPLWSGYYGAAVKLSAIGNSPQNYTISLTGDEIFSIVSITTIINTASNINYTVNIYAGFNFENTLQQQYTAYCNIWLQNNNPIALPGFTTVEIQLYYCYESFTDPIPIEGYGQLTTLSYWNCFEFCYPYCSGSFLVIKGSTLSPNHYAVIFNANGVNYISDWCAGHDAEFSVEIPFDTTGNFFSNGTEIEILSVLQKTPYGTVTALENLANNTIFYILGDCVKPYSSPPFSWWIGLIIGGGAVFVIFIIIIIIILTIIYTLRRRYSSYETIN